MTKAHGFKPYAFILDLIAPRAGFAVSAAFLCGFARCRIHFTRPVALRFFSAVGAEHLLPAVFDELLKFLAACRASVL